MNIESVSLTLDADDLRVMAAALRLYDRTCMVADADVQRIKALVHLAERSESYQGKCYAQVIDERPGGQPVAPPAAEVGGNG